MSQERELAGVHRYSPLVAVPFGIWYRRRSTLTLGAITVATALAFYNWEGLRELLGKAPAWNLRLLPFWFLMVYLLAAVGVAELVRLLALGASWVVSGDGRASAWSRDVGVDGHRWPPPTASRRPGRYRGRRAADLRDERPGRAIDERGNRPVGRTMAASSPWHRRGADRAVRPVADPRQAGLPALLGEVQLAGMRRHRSRVHRKSWRVPPSWTPQRAFRGPSGEPGDAIGAYGTPSR
jgi:hypothetical protein